MKRFLLFAILILLFVNTCAVLDVKQIAENSGNITGAKWDVDFAIPVISRTENMSEYITIPGIAPISISDMSWPVATGTQDMLASPVNLGVSAAASIDFDGDDVNDITLTSIESVSGDGYIELVITSEEQAINVGDFTLTGFQLDSGTENYTFDGGESVSSTVLRLRTTDFLASPGASHDITDGTVDSIDIMGLTLNINTAHATGVNNGLTFTFTIYFGSEYNIVGTMAAAKKIYSITDQDIPFSQGVFEIKDFGIQLDYTNQTPINLNLAGVFKSDQTPIGTTLKDENGNSTIVISQGTGTANLQTSNSNIFSEDNVKVDFDIELPAGAVTITNNMVIDAKLIITGTGTLNTGL